METNPFWAKTGKNKEQSSPTLPPLHLALGRILGLWLLLMIIQLDGAKRTWHHRPKESKTPPGQPHPGAGEVGVKENNPRGVEMWPSGFYVPATAIESSAIPRATMKNETVAYFAFGAGLVPVVYCFPFSAAVFFRFQGCECVAFAPSINILAVWADFNPWSSGPCSFCDLWGCDGKTKLSQRTNDIRRQHLGQGFPSPQEPLHRSGAAAEVWTFN